MKSIHEVEIFVRCCQLLPILLVVDGSLGSDFIFFFLVLLACCLNRCQEVWEMFGAELNEWKVFRPISVFQTNHAPIPFNLSTCYCKTLINDIKIMKKNI